MKLFSILSALLLSLTLYTSVSQACEGKACSAETCNAEICGEGCDGKSCEKNGCAGKACQMKKNKRGTASTTKSSATATATGGTTSTHATTTSTAPGAVTTTATNYQVEMAKGQMHCADCAKKVSEALKSLPNVEQNSVKVILAKNTATLQVKQGSTVTSELIKKTIEEKTGYTVSKVEEVTTSTTKN